MNPNLAKIDRTNEHYTFELAQGVKRTTVTFRNHFGIELAGDLYTPESAASAGNSALAISGPFGAVKEQSSGFYANQMASRGYIALAFDPSYTGESGGEPRYMNSPDINTEDFMAAVDFLSTRDNIDPEKIGIIGICGWGGMAINTAAIDTRIKATVASTMYDMSRVTANGYFDSANNAEARHEARKALMAQRIEDFKAVQAGGTYKLGGGVVDPLPEDAPYFVKDYYDYYKTPPGRCSIFCKGLLRLLQNSTRLSREKSQFKWWLECNSFHFPFEHKTSCLCRRNPECRNGSSWRKSPLPLFWRRCL